MTTRRVLGTLIGAVGPMALIALLLGNQWVYDKIFRSDLARDNDTLGPLLNWLLYPHWRLTTQGRFRDFSWVAVQDLSILLMFVVLAALVFGAARTLNPDRGAVHVVVLGWWATVVAGGFSGFVNGVLQKMVLDYPTDFGNSSVYWLMMVQGGTFGLLYGWLAGAGALVGYQVTRPKAGAGAMQPGQFGQPAPGAPGAPGAPQPIPAGHPAAMPYVPPAQSPYAPGQQGMPGQPGVPGQPGMPGQPGVPGQPYAPGQPYGQGQPYASGQPQQPWAGGPGQAAAPAGHAGYAQQPGYQPQQPAAEPPMPPTPSTPPAEPEKAAEDTPEPEPADDTPERAEAAEDEPKAPGQAPPLSTETRTDDGLQPPR
ncbi:hypothetical protein [Actinomadura sp. 6N118]|uniref:hypothetical protein n=1 Tax=Actinomadura sp. 6N118 TaxID=3375151 RepID=UPI0037A1A0AA